MPSTNSISDLNSPQLLQSSVQNPDVEQLIRDCLNEDSCRLSASGAVVAYSGKYTGRTPKDKYVVTDPSVEHKIWWGNNNRLSRADFDKLRSSLLHYAQGRKLYVIDAFAGADPRYRIAVRFIVERPYHALFIRQLLIRPTAEELIEFSPDWTVLDVGKFSVAAGGDGMRGDAAIALSFEDHQVLIAGTQYAGEMKKSIFTVMNFLLPQQSVLSMHCSANIGPADDTALFFGLSGTGKTTLSTDPYRRLIGDDEHGWSDEGVFNIEGGCYAKCIRLREDREREIWRAIRHGAVLENVVLNSEGIPDFDDESLTENTRAAYPIDFIDNAVAPSVGGHPKNIVFLTCDAMGVLPPISRLTPEQAMIHYLSGYTAKVAGTERGVVEPTLTFSTCFGAPFLPLPPKVYAELLKAKIQQHAVRVWLLNTGWTGGAYGVGTRMDLAHTRSLLNAAFSGQLDEVEYCEEPVFGLSVPLTCPGVPSELLLPRATWPNPDEYDLQAADLKRRFDENFSRFSEK